MEKRELRITNYIEPVPMSGVCTVCGEVFSVVLVSDEAWARTYLESKFQAHNCRTSGREDVNQAGEDRKKTPDDCGRGIRDNLLTIHQLVRHIPEEHLP